ncbi:DUF4227 family protein [Paenibacillus sp.]|uniref:DUF4227 family protein n=1 Tax=Paenibacillus sp. TaxID=58172 RepID=UPI002D3BFED3|nr:DUF4227 family protein [Paenibacillus sp.]HZG55407.1 DUF4227 family protein [Paenibacillus sp.]
MIVPLKRWLHRLKFIVLFIALTYAIYHVFDVVTAWIEPDKYREPGGRAVKVFRHEADAAPAYDSALERLRLFYWYGE